MEGHGEEAVEGRGAEAAVDKVAVDADAVVVDEAANAVDRAAVGKAAFDGAAVEWGFLNILRILTLSNLNNLI